MKEKALHEASTFGFTLLFVMTRGSSFGPSPSILLHSFSTSNLETVGSIILRISELYGLYCRHFQSETYRVCQQSVVQKECKNYVWGWNDLLIPFPIVSWQGMFYRTSLSPLSRSLLWHNRLISKFFSNYQMQMVETSSSQCVLVETCFTWIGTEQLDPRTGGILSFIIWSNSVCCFSVVSTFFDTSCHSCR